ncbi:cytochrome c-type biogenesis protein [Pokkaliibacter sp. CJK22405]|uniref:cytochrome c-type biogenesis protein n=1 Tax=Pokkaliibacter sp. CJK22405 TaxID=3384615 RepID=UPI00398533F9
MKISLLLSLLLFSAIAHAAIDAQQFADPALQARYQQLIHELRCPKCQNQNIGDSDAPIASDLRQEVSSLLKDGKTDDEVRDYMESRYGDFVLYRPKVESKTWVLWYGPFAILLMGALALIILVIRLKTAPAEEAPDQQRLNALLNNDSSKEP